MLIRSIVFLGVLVLATSAWAAAPLGSITSTASFDLNGSAVPVAGVPSWPVTAGDIIATRSAPATVVFHDGSRVVIGAHAKMIIEAKKSGVAIRLLQGSGKYQLARGSALTAVGFDKPVAAQPRTNQGNNGDDNDDNQGGKKPPKPSKSK